MPLGSAGWSKQVAHRLRTHSSWSALLVAADAVGSQRRRAASATPSLWATPSLPGLGFCLLLAKLGLVLERHSWDCATADTSAVVCPARRMGIQTGPSVLTPSFVCTPAFLQSERTLHPSTVAILKLAPETPSPPAIPHASSRTSTRQPPSPP